MRAKTNSVVAVFGSHDKAEAAVRELHKNGFDMKKVSIVGKDYHTEEHAVGYYTTGERMLYWGATGAFWGGLWCLLFGSAFFSLPGLGPLVVGGPLVVWIVDALGGAAIVGGLTAFGAGLMSIGISKHHAAQYETDVMNGKLLVVAHGTATDVEHAKKVLNQVQAETTMVHAESAAIVM